MTKHELQITLECLEWSIKIAKELVIPTLVPTTVKGLKRAVFEVLTNNSGEGKAISWSECFVYAKRFDITNIEI